MIKIRLSSSRTGSVGGTTGLNAPLLPGTVGTEFSLPVLDVPVSSWSVRPHRQQSLVVGGCEDDEALDVPVTSVSPSSPGVCWCWYSQHGNIRCPEGACISWYTSVPGGYVGGLSSGPHNAKCSVLKSIIALFAIRALSPNSAGSSVSPVTVGVVNVPGIVRLSIVLK